MRTAGRMRRRERAAPDRTSSTPLAHLLLLSLFPSLSNSTTLPNSGKPPGNLNSNGSELLVYGKRFGNVFIGVQPTFGYEGDPMRLLFSRSASPHHGFAAYYTYVEKVFGADAVLHFGTHGSLEFMPGKQVGMSGG